MEAGIAELEFYTKAVPSDQEEEGGGDLTSSAPGLCEKRRWRREEGQD